MKQVISVFVLIISLVILTNACDKKDEPIRPNDEIETIMDEIYPFPKENSEYKYTLTLKYEDEYSAATYILPQYGWNIIAPIETRGGCLSVYGSHYVKNYDGELDGSINFIDRIEKITYRKNGKLVVAEPPTVSEEKVYDDFMKCKINTDNGKSLEVEVMPLDMWKDEISNIKIWTSFPLYSGCIWKDESNVDFFYLQGKYLYDDEAYLAPSVIPIKIEVGGWENGESKFILHQRPK